MTGLNLGLPTAWVVKCKKCGCTINCRAIDPQIEHSEPDKAEPPPRHTVIVTCSCCWTAYRYSPAEVFKGAPGPSSNCYDRKKPNNNKEEKSKPGLTIKHVDLDRDAWITGAIANRIPREYGPVLRKLTETIASDHGSRPNGIVEKITGTPPHTFCSFARNNTNAWKAAK